ncbi:UvrD-helicase domain-containing protein [Cohnella luojiensis]|uniref:DNA 3'-5' helicase n=1 Tax=Cohnella luojiensis TaxID=652876 RepID=A0A4Y8LXX9_9BACL|nr:UvrD-helicase domain-containing protein [Cohnella luojiensis]TFE25599.1 DNA helicase UvrD [Cohnella luojiensis]
MAIENYFWNQLSDAWTDREYRKDAAVQNRHYWNSFLKAGNLFDTITLSREQLAVVQQRDKYLLVNGSAGSGKSVTLLGRMFKSMAEESRSQRLLYVTYSTTLIEDARKRCRQSPVYRDLQQNHTIHLMTFHQMVSELMKAVGLMRLESIRTTTVSTSREEDNVYRRTEAYLTNYMKSKEYKSLPRSRQLYTTHMDGFVRDEILWMKGNGFIDEKKYLECDRVGRGTNPRLTVEQRKTIFEIFQGYERFRNERWPGDYDPEDYALLLLQRIGKIPEALKYDHIYIDEMQDLQPMQILALSTLFKKSITMTGDDKQRIYRRSPFSLKALGIEVEGRRSKKLRRNFRSTKQNMKLARSIRFLDTENDREDDLIFVREGPKPEIRLYTEVSRMVNYLVQEVHKIRREDPKASVAIIHRYEGNQWKINNSSARIRLAREFSIIGVESYGRKFDYDKLNPPIFFTDAYSIKGLEFDYVFILHFDREHYPLQNKIKVIEKRHNGETGSNAFDQDLDSILNEEKKVLYVALSRARQKTIMLCVGEKPTYLSPFIRDFQSRDYENFGFNKTMFSR